MGILSSVLPCFKSFNGPVDQFPRNTRRIIRACRGCRFEDPNAEVSFWIEDGRGDLKVHFNLLTAVRDGREDGKAVLDIPQTDIPRVISGLSLWAFERLPPSWIVGEKPVDRDEDEHAAITWEAFRRSGLKNIPFYDLMYKRDEAFSFLADDMAQIDYPRVPYASYIDMAMVPTNGREQILYHALRPLERDPETGALQPMRMEKTNRSLRERIGDLFRDIRSLQEILHQSDSNFIAEEELTTLLRRVAEMEEAAALAAYRLATAGLETFNPFDRAIAIHGLTRQYWYPPQMTAVVFPREGQNPRLFEGMLGPYRDFAFQVRSAGEGFGKWDEIGMEKGIDAMKKALLYIREEHWSRMASGNGPAIAMLQLKLARLLHLIQDSFAHCREFNGWTCKKRVTLNFQGLGDVHDKDDDVLAGPDGKWTRQATMAREATAEALRLLGRLDDRTGKIDLNSFSEAVDRFVGRYFP